MSKATPLSVDSGARERLHGYPYPVFFSEISPLIAEKSPGQKRLMRSLIVVYVGTTDWQGHPLFKRMSRSYTVTVLVADSESDFALKAEGGFSLFNASWTTVLAEMRAFFVRGYHYKWGETTPFLSILDGGYSERICREILAVCPHHDLQGRGDGK